MHTLEALVRDLERGVRMIVRMPLMSAAAILTLGVGIGATAFSYSTTYQFDTMPVAEQDRLMVVLRTTAAGEGPAIPFHDYLDLRERQNVFRDLAAGYRGTLNLVLGDGRPQRTVGGFVTANAFDGLGVSPTLGRSFQAGDDAPGAPPVLLLGHDVWMSRFGADEDVAGTTVRVNGEQATVIGVMPEGFGFPISELAWVPLRWDPTEMERGSGQPLFVWGHLADGVDQDAATAQLQSIAEQIESEFPEANEGVGARAVPYIEGLMPRELYEMAAIIMAMTLGVLLVACANVANLLLARATLRERDVAIRSALGAKRSQVMRHLLSEAFILAVLGGFVAVVLVRVALPWYEGLFAGQERPYWFEFSIKARALGFTAVVTVAAAVLAGIVPAIRATGAGVGEVLRHDARGSSSMRVGRFERGLVVMELAVSCALLIAAGLMEKSVIDLNRADLGFDPGPVMTARLGLFDFDYPDSAARNRFFHEVLEEVRGQPGAQAAALTNIAPGTSQVLQSFRVEGETYPLDEDVPQAGGVVVSPGYFETFGVEIEEGRDFLSTESDGSGERAVIVNRAFVDRYLEGGEALGRRIGLGAEEPADDAWVTIVGVVADTHQGIGFIGESDPDPEIIYQPIGSVDPSFMTVAVRVRGEPEAFAPQLREAVSRVDPRLPLYWVRDMEAALHEAWFGPRSLTVLVRFISVAGLFLAVVGLYGVVHFSVTSRLREIGIRIALGADRASTLGFVFRRVLFQLAVGGVLGLALGYALGKPLSTVLVHVESWNMGVAVIVVSILGITSVGAALPPALRAIHVDPVESLKVE